MADALALSSTFTGAVRSVNDKGLKLEGHESWLNFSRYAVGIVAPERGDAVTVTVDKAGFVRAVEIVAVGSGATDGPHAAVRPAPEQRAASATRDATITRLAVLKAAAEYASSKPESKSTDVLAIAAAWERWVLRSDEGAAPHLSTSSTSREDPTDAS